MSDMTDVNDQAFKGGLTLGFVSASLLLVLVGALIGHCREAAGFGRGLAHGRCDADCRWIHNEGRWDGVVYGEYDDEDEECRCIRVLDGTAP